MNPSHPFVGPYFNQNAFPSRALFLCSFSKGYHFSLSIFLSQLPIYHPQRLIFKKKNRFSGSGLFLRHFPFVFLKQLNLFVVKRCLGPFLRQWLSRTLAFQAFAAASGRRREFCGGLFVEFLFFDVLDDR